MSLLGKVAVVAGATGIVGGGIVRRLLEEGAVVVAPLRSQGSRDKVITAVEGAQFPATNLHTPVADWGLEEGAAELARFVREELAQGAVDHVVSIAGGRVPIGLATELDLPELEAGFHSKLGGHIFLARHLLPLLTEYASSSYIVVTGIAGEVLPAPQLTPLAIYNSAVYALVLGLQAEKRGKPYRINELRIGAAIRRDTESNNPNFPDFPAFPASKIGDVAVSIATGAQRDQVLRVTPEDLQ